MVVFDDEQRELIRLLDLDLPESLVQPQKPQKKEILIKEGLNYKAGFELLTNPHQNFSFAIGLLPNKVSCSQNFPDDQHHKQAVGTNQDHSFCSGQSQSSSRAKKEKHGC